LDEKTVTVGAQEIAPGAGHALHRETPREFTGLLEQFIADLG
jgi:hypothetical protein